MIVFVEGEMFTQGNPGKYPAEDLAAEGLVVVSVHYRLNIFGRSQRRKTDRFNRIDVLMVTDSDLSSASL